MTTLEAEKPDLATAPLHQGEDEAPRPPPAQSLGERIARIAVPVACSSCCSSSGRSIVDVAHVPHYILPSPLRIAQAFGTDYPILLPALLVTLKITFSALAIALVGGVALAILMAQSKWIELALYPYAVILQVTPIVAIAPLILIYTPEHPDGAPHLRLDRRLLPGALQHHAGAALDRPQPAQPVRALRRQPLADAHPAQAARTRCPISSPA